MVGVRNERRHSGSGYTLAAIITRSEHVGAAASHVRKCGMSALVEWLCMVAEAEKRTTVSFCAVAVSCSTAAN